MKVYFLLGLALSSTALAAGSTSQTSASLATAPHQKNLQNVRKEIDLLKKDLAAKQAVQKDAQSAIKDSEQAIRQTNQLLANLEKKHETTADKLADLRNQIDAINHKTSLIRQRIATMMAEQYKNGQQHDALSVMLNNSDPNQSSRDLEYYRYITKAQQQVATTLVQQQQQLESLSKQLIDEVAKLDAVTQKKSQEKNQLIHQKENKQTQLSKINGEIQQGQNKLTKLQEDEKRLSNLITQINLEIAKRQQEAKEKAEKERKNRILAAQKENERRRKLAENAKKQGKPVPEEAKKPVVVEKVDDVADSSTSGRTFASLQGKMKLPVSGQLAGRFGTQRSEGTTWKGVFIKTAVGQAVHAVADGRVVYADALRGFGNAVIIDHGSNYMTVYTGLSALAKTTGSNVKAGDTIGSTGTLDGGESGLYFEIRHLGQPLNPQTWAH